MNKGVRIVLAGITVTALVGCFVSSPQVSYYSLYASMQRPVTATADTLAVSVGPVTVPDILKRPQIATGGTDGLYRLAEFHRWSGELDRDFARALAEQLSASLGTEQVATFPWDQNFAPTCRVLVDVLNMGGELGKEATLSVRWALLDLQGKRPQVIRRSELQEIPAEGDYPAWVAAQQRNVARLGEEIAEEIRLLTR